jgi:hypothetical protein
MSGEYDMAADIYLWERLRWRVMILFAITRVLDVCDQRRLRVYRQQLQTTVVVRVHCGEIDRITARCDSCKSETCFTEAVLHLPKHSGQIYVFDWAARLSIIALERWAWIIPYVSYKTL